jgi:putative transposase
MPNHFHGILWILDSPECTGEAFAREVQTIDNPKMANASPQPKGTKPGSLNAILQNFKSISTRKINQKLKTPGNKIWQRDYYERIIRDDRQLNAIRKYILANPMKWAEDGDYPHG